MLDINFGIPDTSVASISSHVLKVVLIDFLKYHSKCVLTALSRWPP